MTKLWHQEILNNLTIQQSEISVIYGDTMGYPELPMEGLTNFLRRMALGPVKQEIIFNKYKVKLSKSDDFDGTIEKGQPGYDMMVELIQEAIDVKRFSELHDVAPSEIAAEHLFATLSPALGLSMDPADQEVFDQFVEDDNPLAGNSMPDAFGRLHQYFYPDGASLVRFSANDWVAPPLALVIEDGDLIFDSDSPLVDPERTYLSYIRQWASKPLVNCTGDPHRIFIISPSRIGLRDALTQGRVATVNIPLPTEEERTVFIEQNLRAEWDMEEGLDAASLARITGALNLQQIEDVVYQAEYNRTQDKGAVLTRKMVQDRKDTLVRDVYGSVIEIEYPEAGFDNLIVYDGLKNYFVEYAAPLLEKSDPLCPKGCVLSGPPGTGKTAFPKALAAHLKLPMVTVAMDKIKSKYVGESNKNMAKLAEGIAALAPAVILLDEIDKIMPTGDDNTGVSQEILGQLQTFLSDIPRGKAFFIATTNYPSKIPRALLRPGRFEEVIPLLPQHIDGRRPEVFSVIAKRMGVPVAPEVDYEGLKHDLLTGADIERVLIKANRAKVADGVDLIDNKHLAHALENIVPTIATSQEMVTEALVFAGDKSYIPESMRDSADKAVKEQARQQTRRVQQVV